LPAHIAIIMDGNGRWARKRGLPRIAGHKAGVKVLRSIVMACVERDIIALTVYAFSSENWKRPESEVSRLIKLFISTLEKETDELHNNNIRLNFIGDIAVFPSELQASIESAQERTRDNTGLRFNVAINYGGRADITAATRKVAEAVLSGKISLDEIDEDMMASEVSLSDLPEPDLFIRTGGEKRISNFLLWQTAYTELYFCDCLWPDFNEKAFDEALQWYAGRERRFGRISEQVTN